METESLSGKGSSAATTRSAEEVDLLQRSTKKTKRPRDNKETPGQTPLADTVQEAALFAGLKSPDSANLRTPCEVEGATPRDTRDQQPPREGNQTKEAQAKTKERRGQRRADNRTPGVTNRGRIQAQHPSANLGILETSSRYAALDYLTEIETNPASEGYLPTTTFNNPPRNLPNIRTNSHPQSQTTRRSDVQLQRNIQPQSAGRGAHGGRNGRSGAPRHAAAESEHTVVRGSRLGKQVATTVVQHDIPETSSRAYIDHNVLGEPPDLARIFDNNQLEADADMVDDTSQSGQIDQDGPVL
nr:uncharacterized protein LOC109179535 isoform X2 [Ipomoea trifida]